MVRYGAKNHTSSVLTLLLLSCSLLPSLALPSSLAAVAPYSIDIRYWPESQTKNVSLPRYDLGGQIEDSQPTKKANSGQTNETATEGSRVSYEKTEWPATVMALVDVTDGSREETLANQTTSIPIETNFLAITTKPEQANSTVPDSEASSKNAADCTSLSVIVIIIIVLILVLNSLCWLSFHFFKIQMHEKKIETLAEQLKSSISKPKDTRTPGQQTPWTLAPTTRSDLVEKPPLKLSYPETRKSLLAPNDKPPAQKSKKSLKSLMTKSAKSIS